MFSLGELLKSLSSELWLCLLFLVAVSLSAPARPQPHLYQGGARAAQHCWLLECRDSNGAAGIGPWAEGSCFEMPSLSVTAGLWAELKGACEPHMLPSVALLVL